MRVMVVREYGKAPVVSEVADPVGPAAQVLAASLNPVDMTVAAELNPFRRPRFSRCRRGNAPTPSPGWQSTPRPGN